MTLTKEMLLTAADAAEVYPPGHSIDWVFEEFK
jgi:hypothetical protein